LNPELLALKPYPFERLNQLKASCKAPAELAPILLSIGEPKHPVPTLVTQALSNHLDELGQYPATRGSEPLREAIAQWLTRRFDLTTLNAEQHLLPVNGTREALFSFVQATIDRSKPAKVLMPNPFYQIYEGAALLSGAEPCYINVTEASQFEPDFDAVDEADWRACQLLFICTPGNPSGAVLSLERLQWLIKQAEKHDFIIASDECYSEIYPDENNPPPGLLQAAQLMGNDQYKRCVVFHSLSKRSNAPGLRSGFVAGDATIIKQYLLYRTYHGCAMSLPVQHASIAAWSDELHVKESRQLYRNKFAQIVPLLSPWLSVEQPAGGFYLWAGTPGSDTDFAQKLYQQQNITVLPGSYLSRDTTAGNPGNGRVRIALVAPEAACIEAAERIVQFMQRIR